MDIEIKNPIKITFELIGIDEHIPSLNFDVTIIVKKFGYSSEVHFQIWIECHFFDEFVRCLGRDKIACLKDMNNCFALVLDLAIGKFEWSCAKDDVNGCIISSKGSEKLNSDNKEEICMAFRSFPKWW
ncbi:hypothetical protein JD508_00070 [Aeromonas jandaei]|uniref:hypothetical protein n=1 Tax=Aeromonas jandaei TaxID=650 RepID=UPI00191D4A6D|nr:hypothetical protein [Aeromonas jandaei]MBL0608680.1 hypothetical protein [Aeromonas jandaei]